MRTAACRPRCRTRRTHSEMNSSWRPMADICALSSSSAWAGSRNWRRNTRSRYLAWKAVMAGSMPWPVTSPITAAIRVGADAAHVVEVAGHQARAGLVDAAELEPGDVGQLVGGQPLGPAARAPARPAPAPPGPGARARCGSARAGPPSRSCGPSTIDTTAGTATTKVTSSASVVWAKASTSAHHRQQAVEDGGVEVLAVVGPGDGLEIGVVGLGLDPAQQPQAVPGRPAPDDRGEPRRQAPRRARTGCSMVERCYRSGPVRNAVGRALPSHCPVRSAVPGVPQQHFLGHGGHVAAVLVEDVPDRQAPAAHEGLAA